MMLDLCDCFIGMNLTGFASECLWYFVLWVVFGDGKKLVVVETHQQYELQRLIIIKIKFITNQETDFQK